jgi:hypothetical protein
MPLIVYNNILQIGVNEYKQKTTKNIFWWFRMFKKIQPMN